jgi:hypothetical protein
MMKVAEIEEAEKDKMRNKCKKIIDHGTCPVCWACVYAPSVCVCGVFVRKETQRWEAIAVLCTDYGLTVATVSPCLTIYHSIRRHSGITCFINRQLIYNFPEQIFTEAGVISIEHADFDGALQCCVAFMRGCV